MAEQIILTTDGDFYVDEQFDGIVLLPSGGMVDDDAPPSGATFIFVQVLLL